MEFRSGFLAVIKSKTPIQDYGYCIHLSGRKNCNGFYPVVSLLTPNMTRNMNGDNMIRFIFCFVKSVCILSVTNANHTDITAPIANNHCISFVISNVFVVKSISIT